MAKYCPNCGTENADTAMTCANCGVAFVQGAAPAPAAPAAPAAPGAKSKMAAGLLGIFLGAFGVHNFYLGNTGKAVAQLLITILSCGALSFVSGVWGLIEGIMILTGSIAVDGKGNPLAQ
jgi:TM2 domain-containing membrane protein YozV